MTTLLLFSVALPWNWIGFAPGQAPARPVPTAVGEVPFPARPVTLTAFQVPDVPTLPPAAPEANCPCDCGRTGLCICPTCPTGREPNARPVPAYAPPKAPVAPVGNPPTRPLRRVVPVAPVAPWPSQAPYRASYVVPVYRYTPRTYYVSRPSRPFRRLFGGGGCSVDPFTGVVTCR